MLPAPTAMTTNGGRDSLAGLDVASVLDMLWQKLEAIHQGEVTKALARPGAASGETRAALEALSVAIVRTVFDRCAVVLREGGPRCARSVSELFDLRSG
jgi:Glutamyl-tRNAGlu reductase, dimerisation domain